MRFWVELPESVRDEIAVRAAAIGVLPSELGGDYLAAAVRTGCVPVGASALWSAERIHRVLGTIESADLLNEVRKITLIARERNGSVMQPQRSSVSPTIPARPAR